MNLHAIVSGVISAVNPNIPVAVQFSQSQTVNADGTTTPAFSAPVYMRGQVQPMSGGNLRQVESLNIQGVMKAIYLFGEVDGLVRISQKGGDLVILPDNTVWLVVQILEPWTLTAHWVKAALALQNQTSTLF